MRFPLVAAAIVALSLIACSGPTEPTSEIGPEETRVETPEVSEPSPSSTPLTRKSRGNTLIETPEYTGVIISEKGASEFDYVFGSSSPAFWEPSIDDISRAEDRIRQFLVSMQDDPKTEPYQQDNVSFILNNLDQYRRQYVGIVVDGERRIWSNFFFSGDSYPDWERLPVYVLDGGRDYWQIEYDVIEDECINFYVHGEA